MGYSLDGLGSIPGMGNNSLFNSIQTGSGTHPASSYSMNTVDSFSGSKAAGV
jgi:hypothetical protein